MSAPQSLPLRLLRTPPPYADESLPGYLVRLTEANYYALPQWWLPLAGLSGTLLTSWRRLVMTETDFAPLAEMTGLPVAEWQAWSAATKRASPLRFRIAQLCPACLAEENYCRRAWDELAVTVCPRHQSVLLDRCPACQQRLRWQRSRISVCRCGADWRRTATTNEAVASRAPYPASQAWLQCATVPGATDAHPLDGSARRHALITLAGFCTPAHDHWPLSEALEMAERGAYLEKAAQVLLGGAVAFADFCLAQVRRGLLHNLAVQLQRLATHHPTLAYLCFTLEQLVAEWQAQAGEGGWLTLPTYFLTATAAREELRFSAAQWQYFRAERQLKLWPDPWDPQRNWLRSDHFFSARQQYSHAFTLPETAQVLGVTLSDVRELLDTGWLTLTSGPTLDGFPEERIRGDELQSLLQTFRVSEWTPAASWDEGQARGEFVDAVSVVTALRANGLCLHDWLAAVQRGVLPSLAGPGLSYLPGYCLTQFHFRATELTAYFAEQGVSVVFPAPPPLTTAPAEQRGAERLPTLSVASPPPGASGTAVPQVDPPFAALPTLPETLVAASRLTTSSIDQPPRIVNWCALARALRRQEKLAAQRSARPNPDWHTVAELRTAARRWLVTPARNPA